MHFEIVRRSMKIKEKNDMAWSINCFFSCSALRNQGRFNQEIPFIF